jgi:hypothetical protein
MISSSRATMVQLRTHTVRFCTRASFGAAMMQKCTARAPPQCRS